MSFSTNLTVEGLDLLVKEKLISQHRILPAVVVVLSHSCSQSEVKGRTEMWEKKQV